MLPELETLREEALRYRPTLPPLDPGVQDPDCFSLEFRKLDRAFSLRLWGSYPSPPPSDLGVHISDLLSQTLESNPSSPPLDPRVQTSAFSLRPWDSDSCSLSSFRASPWMAPKLLSFHPMGG